MDNIDNTEKTIYQHQINKFPPLKIENFNQTNIILK